MLTPVLVRVTNLSIPGGYLRRKTTKGRDNKKVFLELCGIHELIS